MESYLAPQNTANAQREYAGTAIPEASGLTGVCNRMAEAIKQMDEFVGQIEATESRLNGSRPQAEGKGGGAQQPRPVANGTIDLMQMGHDELQTRISRAFIALNSLQRSI